MHDLLDAITVVVDSAPDALPAIGRVRAAIRSPRVSPAIVDGANETIREQLAVAATLANTEDDRNLAELIRDRSDELRWTISYANHSEPDMHEFHQGYFTAPIMGPSRLDGAKIPSDGVSLYITIQAPGINYPSHVHKAPELYHVIAGEGLWQKGGGEYAIQPPGAWIDHPTGTRHAMRTADQPMLSLAFWTDDVDSISVIVRH